MGSVSRAVYGICGPVSSEKCNDLAERLACRGVDRDLSPVVERGPAAVQDRQRPTRAKGLKRELGDWEDLERGPHDEHRRRTAGQLVGAIDGSSRQQLAEEDDVGL